MTKAEKALSRESEALFIKVNQDKGACCEIAELGKAETLLVMRILQDPKRARALDEYEPLINAFCAELRASARDDSDAGSKITEEEFSEAFLTALHVYQTEAIGVMAAEVTKQYDKMETDLVSGTASALEVQVETASQQFALPKLPNPEKDCVIS